MATLLDSGRFTSDGNARIIPCPASCDYFKVWNDTQIATTANPGRGCIFEWQRGLGAADGWMHTKQNTSNALDLEKITTGGFTFVSAPPAPEAQVTGTALTAANPAVATAVGHGYSVGDRIRVYGTTGMLQIAGMDFTVTAVGGANNYTLGYLNAGGFAAPATAILSRRLPAAELVRPAFHYITAVTQAAQAVVTFSVTHNYQLGELIYFRVPNDMGMVELDGQVGRVVAVSTANNTVTVNIDSTAYTAFAFPASASSPVRHAVAAPAGQQGYLDTLVSPSVQRGYDTRLAFHSGQFYPYMLLGAGADGPAGSNNDVIYWQAWKGDQNINT